MSSWHSYSSIYSFGHRAVSRLLDGEVIVEEKIDGSQFSFGVFDEFPPAIVDIVPRWGPSERVLKVRSKGCVMITDAPEKMFARGVEHIKTIQHLLHPGWTYRGEYLAKPHHNALSYDRIPAGHVILFDIETDECNFLGPDKKREEAARVGLECVPELFRGRIGTVEQFRSYLETVSVLGGQKIEGVVVKPLDYNLFGMDKKVLMAKFVSEAFKETHAKTWGENNPKGKDIIGLIGDRLTTQARWTKAIQHMKEQGKLEDSPKDIGMLIREIPQDILKECEEEIKQDLFDWAWPSIQRMVTRGMPQYYKDHLLRQQFERVEDVPTYLEDRWVAAGVDNPMDESVVPTYMGATEE